MGRNGMDRRWWTWVVASAGLLGAWPAAAQQTPDAAPLMNVPAALSGFEDAGTLYIYKAEERIATCEFEWALDGLVRSRTTFSFNGQQMKTSLEIVPDVEGRWLHVTMDTPVGLISLDREEDIARRVIGDDTTLITLRPNAVLWENQTPILISQAVRLYDRAKGGQQTWPVFVVPSDMFDLRLERLEPVKRSVEGKEEEFERFMYGLPGVDITAWVDSKGRVVLADVPAQHATYVRKGYESLRGKASELASKPVYEIIVASNAKVPMRDGVELATDVYRPDTEAQAPAILIRTPYKKEMAELQGRYYARRGYVVAVQDCRGRFASPGTWEPFVHEAHDGYDAIEWLARQPWCNGRVGMIGASYLGWVQWWAASERPPHLVTIIPNVSPPDPFYNIPYEYGTFMLAGSLWWADVLESQATADITGVAMSRIGEKRYGELLRALPVIDLDKAVLGKENAYWRKWIEHPTNDAYWQSCSFRDKITQVNIPVFHQSGWFDGDGIGTKLNYAQMKAADHPHQKLVLGPWGHTATAQRLIGERDFGPGAIVDMDVAYLRWMDQWLKGRDTGILTEPLVSVFVMGSNVWLHANDYPLPYARFEKWFLRGGGKANGLRGDGRLSPEAPPADEPPDKYAYDPNDPTPSPQFYEVPDREGATTQARDEQKRAAAAHYNEVLEARRDILVYTSEPLKEPLTFAGPISAVLFASSSAKDTDWFMRLGEVDENGQVFPLVEGKLRARFRDSTRQAILLEPGQVYDFKLDLWQTGITIPAGRRVRVEVASASFPLFSRNLNTGGHNETETEFVTAEQTIYHSLERPSYVLLPVIPAEKLKIKDNLHAPEDMATPK